MAYVASLRKNKRTTLERMEKFISKDLFTDVNLHGRRYKEEKEVTEIGHWTGASSEVDWRKYPFSVASSQTFKPVEIGDKFGPTWATHWFKVIIDVPELWKGETVHFVWNSNSEALLWSSDGRPVQGFSHLADPGREYYVLSENFNPSEARFVFYVEMACNGAFGAAGNDLIGPPDMNKEFKLETCMIGAFNKDAYALAMDLEILASLAREDPEDGFVAHRALFTGNHMLNLMVDKKDEQAKKLADEFFASGKERTLDFGVVAVGNCHIDSAWLWPVRETIRKCARSFSNAIRLMEVYPEYLFAASQAQQFEWIKEYYPTLFEEIKGRVKEGRFIPVGGAWTELDGNIPSGESFVRQFLLGQEFFQKEFGVTCDEFWLPDTFGYSAQIPQILKHVGIKYFLTQKISWNVVNKFPHHSFVWEGLDGSTVLSHFPPTNSYVDRVTVSDVRTLMKNYSDKGRGTQAIMLYGFGDGGGGPTQDMLERRKRLEHIPGFPEVKPGKPKDFWKKLEEESGNLCRWVGELYLEMHNGTYTTQAAIKRGNRRCEELLQTTEFLLSMLIAHQGVDDALLKDWREKLKTAWKKVLLNQFHDILPGSSIEMVNIEARMVYAEVLRDVEAVMKKVAEAFFGDGGQLTVLFNPLSWPRQEVIRVPKDAHITTLDAQEDDFGQFIAVDVPQQTVTRIKQMQLPERGVKIEMDADGNFVMENVRFRAVVDKYGRIISSTIHGWGKEAVCRDAKMANLICIYDDIPLFWDAWDVMDYHLETRRVLNQPGAEGVTIEEVKVSQQGPLVGAVQWKMTFGNGSVFSQRIIMNSESPYLTFETNVEWKENHKFLKVEFPLNILARSATYEVQYGHLERPTHANTSWDWAKFEVVGHKWADMSEHDFGVAILSESKYGWSADRNKLCLSLLRAPKSPDAHADIGSHAFKYGFMPHLGSFQAAGVIQRAFEFNRPLIPLPCSSHPGTAADKGAAWITSDHPAVIIDTVKPAERDDRALVIRMYEAFGSHCTGKVTLNFPVRAVSGCDGLENLIPDKATLKLLPEGPATAFPIEFSPFQIQSFLVELF